MKGVVTKSTGSWYKVLTPQGQTIECRLRGKLKLGGSKATNPVAVGDHVQISSSGSEQWVIEDILDRKNYIIRKATKLSRQTHVIAANLDQAVIIATIRLPKTSTGFIDRFLATCEAYSIPACIVFNKIDLLQKTEWQEALSELTNIYEKAGYPCIHVSATERQNLDQFSTLLQDKVSLLSGHSGVGKSALINAIEPRLNLKVQEVSKAHQKGKHTTTFAEMFHLGLGGAIIDTPGIKEFGLVDFEAWELCHYFPEMRKYFNQCHYDNCTHFNEPGCMVKHEVEKGSISLSRYANYLNMLIGEDRRK